MGYYTVSEVARLLGARPRDISDLFYKRVLSDEDCPIIGGRRLIPPDYVAFIARTLRRIGRLTEQAKESVASVTAGSTEGCPA